jgi:hypothetical protein
MTLLEILCSGELVEKISKDCHDPHHDDRWCSTCEARESGIEQYRKAIIDEFNNQPEQGRK